MKFESMVERILREQSIVAIDPAHIDYSDPYWQTPEGKAERADRDQRYNAMIQRQQQSQPSPSLSPSPSPSPQQVSSRGSLMPSPEASKTNDLWWDQNSDYMRGSYPDADKLWDQVRKAYESGDDQAYKNAIRDYDNKIAEIEGPRRPQSTAQQKPTPQPATAASSQPTPTPAPQASQADINKARQDMVNKVEEYMRDVESRFPMADNSQMRDSYMQKIDMFLNGVTDKGTLDNQIKSFGLEMDNAKQQSERYLAGNQFQQQYQQATQSQQNVTGRTPQQIYGSQGKLWDPWAKQPQGQTPSQQSQPIPAPSQTSATAQMNQKFNQPQSYTGQYMTPPKKAPFTATKTY